MNINPVSNNLNTFRTAIEGAKKAEKGLEKSAEKIANGEVEAENFVNLTIDKRIHSANLKAAEVADEQLKNSLDLFA